MKALNLKSVFAKNSKRVTAVLLTLIMVLSMFFSCGIVANADSGEFPTGKKMMHVDASYAVDWAQRIVLTKDTTYIFKAKIAMARGTFTGTGEGDSIAVGARLTGSGGWNCSTWMNSTHMDTMDLVSYDEATSEYTFKFTYTGETDTGTGERAGVAFGFFTIVGSGAEFYAADMHLYAESDTAKTNLIKDADFAQGLTKAWRGFETGYDVIDYPDGDSGTQGEVALKFNNSDYYRYYELHEASNNDQWLKISIEAYNEGLFVKEDVNIGKQMMHIDFEDGRDWGQRLTLTKDTTYVAQFKLSDNSNGFREDPAVEQGSTFFNVRPVSNGQTMGTTYNGTNVKNSITLVSYDEATKLYTYEFTYTEDTKVCQVGFTSAGAVDLYVCDMLLYDKADTAKTNLFKNADFANGLDSNWVGNAWGRSTAHDGAIFGDTVQVCEKFENGLYKSYTCQNIAVTLIDYDETIFGAIDDGEDDDETSETTLKQMRVKITGTDYYWGQEVVLTQGKTYQLDMKLKMVEGTHTGSGSNDSVWIGTFTKANGYFGKNQHSTHYDPNGSDAAKAVKQIVNNADTYDYTYEFTYAGPDDTANLVGFFCQSTTTEFIVADFSFHEKGSDVELFKNSLFTNGLDANWKAEWGQNAANEKYGTNGVDGKPYKFENDKTSPTKVITLEAYDETIFGAPNNEIDSDSMMMHVKLPAKQDWAQRVKGLVQNETYIFEAKIKIISGAEGDVFDGNLRFGVRPTKGTGYLLDGWGNYTGDANNSVKLISYDSATGKYKVEFTNTTNESSGKMGYAVGFFNEGNNLADFYVADMKFYKKSEPNVNLFSNADFINGLDYSWMGYGDGWGTDYLSDKNMEIMSDKFADGRFSYYSVISNTNKANGEAPLEAWLMDYEKSIFEAAAFPTGKKMMHLDFEEGKDWGQRLTLTKGKTYVAQFKLKDNANCFREDPAIEEGATFFNVRPVVGGETKGTTYNGTNVKDSIKLVSFDVTTSTYTYEFTYTQETGTVQVGFSSAAAADLYVADMVLYDKADTQKTNLFKNSDFSNGLDSNWVGNAWGRSTAHDGATFGDTVQTCEKFDNGLYKSYTCKNIAVTILYCADDVFNVEIPDSSNEAYYVSEDGSDTTGDGSFGKPFKSISKAMAAIEANGDITKGIIYLTGKVDYDYTAHSKHITITTADKIDVATLNIVAGWTSAGGDLTIDGVIFTSTDGNPQLATGGYKVTIKNIRNAASATETQNSLVFVGPNTNNTNNKRDYVVFEEINGKKYAYNVRIGSVPNEGSISKGLDIILGKDAYLNSMSFWYGAKYSGNVNITVNGGGLKNALNDMNPSYSVASPEFQKALQIIINNGLEDSFPIDDSVKSLTAAKGVWYLYGDTSGVTLSATDTEGKFKVNEDGKTVYAKNRKTGEKVEGKDGFITLTVGEWDFSANPFYELSDGKKMLILERTGDNTGDPGRFGQNITLEKGKNYIIKLKLVFKKGGINDSIWFAVMKKAGGSSFATLYDVRLSGDSAIELVEESDTLYEFTYKVSNFSGDTGEYFIGFQIRGETLLYLADYSVTEEGKTENLLVNADFNKGLYGFRSWWYSADENSVVFDKLGGSGTGSARLADYDEKVFTLPSENDGDRNMLEIVGGTGYMTLWQRFVNKLKAGKTYIFEFSAASEYELDGMMARDGERKLVYNNPAPTKIIEEDGYQTRVFEFTVPEDIGSEVFVGVQLAAGEKGFIFDLKLYDKDDAKKKNLFLNSRFSDGLDNWLWGWSAKFTSDHYNEYDGLGKFEWSKPDETSKLTVMAFDLEKTIPYTDDTRFNDGEWWNKTDVGAAGKISGVLVDENGKALADAKIIARGGESFTATTNAKGEFEFKDLPADTYEIFVIDGEGNERTTGYAAVLKDKNEITIKIVSDASGLIVIPQGVIKGNVYTADKKPVADLTIRLGNKETKTDAEGYFEFSELKAGDYKIEAIDADGNVYVLKELTLEADNTNSYRLLYQPASDSDNDSNVDTDVNDGEDNEDDGKGFPWLVVLAIAAGAVLLAAAAIVIIIILLNKKK